MRALLNWIALRKASAKTRHHPTDATLIVRRVWVDKNQCTAMTLCESESEGLIEYSEEQGASVVKEHALQRTQQELKLLLEASEVCAMSAFYLETEDGRVINLDHDEVQQAITSGKYRWV